MKHNRKKVLIILEELMKMLMKLGCTNMTANIDKEETQCIIKVKGNYTEDKRRYFGEIEKCLQCGRNEEMEECYWSISGAAEIDQDSELYIVGSMLDRCEIHDTGEELEIIGYRKT